MSSDVGDIVFTRPAQQLLTSSVRSGVIGHTCHPSTWDVDAGGFEVLGRPWLHSQFGPAWAMEDSASKHINKQKGN